MRENDEMSAKEILTQVAALVASHPDVNVLGLRSSQLAERISAGTATRDEVDTWTRCQPHVRGPLNSYYCAVDSAIRSMTGGGFYPGPNRVAIESDRWLANATGHLHDLLAVAR